MGSSHVIVGLTVPVELINEALEQIMSLLSPAVVQNALQNALTFIEKEPHVSGELVKRG